MYVTLNYWIRSNVLTPWWISQDQIACKSYTRLIAVKQHTYNQCTWLEYSPCSTELTEDLLSVSSPVEEKVRKALVSSSPGLVLFVSNTWSPIPLSDVFPSSTLIVVLFTAVTRKPRVCILIPVYSLTIDNYICLGWTSFICQCLMNLILKRS